MDPALEEDPRAKEEKKQQWTSGGVSRFARENRKEKEEN